MVFYAPTLRQKIAPDLGVFWWHGSPVNATLSAETAAQLGITSAPSEVYIEVLTKNPDGSFEVSADSGNETEEPETMMPSAATSAAPEFPATMRM